MFERKVLKIKQEISEITKNPVMDAFNIEECRKLQNEYESDDFIKEKIDKCINHLDKVGVDFNPHYRAAYEEYNEAITYFELKTKYDTKSVPEGEEKTPDFKVKKENTFPFNIFIEVKALSFLDGNLNYMSAQESGLDARISLEEQTDNGEKIVFAESTISPFLKHNNWPTHTEVIKIYIDKINNNIKKGQYESGDTVLLVDIKQLLLGSHWDQSAVAIFQEGMTKSMVSGVLWNTAFGKHGDPIYKAIEFEGKENLDSPLSKNGILVDHDYIKGLVFATYENLQDRKYVGFYRVKQENNPVVSFITDFCDFSNNDLNTSAWSVLQKE